MKAEFRDGQHVLNLIGLRKKRKQHKVTALWRQTAALLAITYRDKETVWRAEVMQEEMASREFFRSFGGSCGPNGSSLFGNPKVAGSILNKGPKW